MIAPETSGTVTVDIAAGAEVALVETSDPPAYQRIARRAQCLRELELSDLIIAARLGVTDKTVVKAIAWLRNAVLG